MVDESVKKLAEVLVNYSVFVKKGETVSINGGIEAQDLIKEIYRLCIKKGSYPIVNVGLPGLSYIYYKYASKDQLKKFPRIQEYEIKHTQKYIGIGSPKNTREFTNINPEKITIRSKVVESLGNYIVNAKPKIYRCSLDYPTNALAQDAEMSLEEYEFFLFKACLQNWSKLSKRFKILRDKLNKGKEFRMVGKDTDLTMRIHPKSFVIDDGHENMPGGEVFGSPVKLSTTGHIRFTYPAIRNGVEVTNIYCEFKNGKCIKATADKNQKFLNRLLDTDKGSRYIGEIGIGMNPKVTKFTKNLLFDEKIQNTIHLAFGMAYKECGQPNKSALHWDIVKDMSKGGKIYLDNKLVFKNKWLI